jgi:hypothetical protein
MTDVPEIKILLPDGSTYEPSESYRKALLMQVKEEETDEVLDQLVDKIIEHWTKRTVPTKFRHDNSWLQDFKDNCRYAKRDPTSDEREDIPDDLSWMPETCETTRWAEERINFDEKVKEIFGEDWEHNYPRTYKVSDERDKKDEYPKVFQVQESGETVERDWQDDLSLPEVDQPTWWQDGDSLRYIILPTEQYKEWEDLLVERSKAEVEVADEVDERAKEEMPQPYFENMADLADKVFYQAFRLGIMSIAMEEITEDGENPIEIIGIGDDKVTHYKGENMIEYDRSEEEYDEPE